MRAPRGVDPRTAALAMAVAGVLLVVLGIFLFYAPAGIVAAGLALLGAVTFDPESARRLRWPR